MRARSFFLLSTLALAAAPPACRLFRKSAHDGAASATASAAPSGIALPAIASLESPNWKSLDDPSFIGLPHGCQLGRGVRRAPLPSGTVRFTAPAGGSELVMAVDADGNDSVERAGVLDAEGRTSAAFPWATLSAPPIMLRSTSGLMAVRTTVSSGGLRSAVVGMSTGPFHAFVEGDQLEVVDAVCRGSTCAVLTTFAAKSAGPGATLMMGDPLAAASTWKRIDLPAGDEEWAPFSILDFEAGAVVVALSARDKIGIWRVEAGQTAHVGTIEAPLGVYDVALGESPVAIAPGESIDTECAKDGFVVKLLGANGKALDIDAQVPPETVVVRRIDGGFIVGWLGPTRCRTRNRQTARAFLLGRDGAPKSSTMAMTEADGFAISTHGADVDLWLARQGELVWAKGTCRIPEPVAK